MCMDMEGTNIVVAIVGGGEVWYACGCGAIGIDCGGGVSWLWIIHGALVTLFLPFYRKKLL